MDEHTCGESLRNWGVLNLQRLLEFGKVPWPAMCQVGNVFKANATDFGIIKPRFDSYDVAVTEDVC